MIWGMWVLLGGDKAAHGAGISSQRRSVVGTWLHFVRRIAKL